MKRQEKAKIVEVMKQARLLITNKSTWKSTTMFEYDQFLSELDEAIARMESEASV